MEKTSQIRNIRLSNAKSWEDKWFFTFDIDWAEDFVLSHTIDIVENAGIEATWLATHKTPLLERIASNPKFEIGIHPNFNPLLDGLPTDFAYPRSAREVLESILEIVPGAVTVRSHSLVFSSRLAKLFAEYGLIFDLNASIPAGVISHFVPWELETRIIKVPTCFHDDEAVITSREPDWSLHRGVRVLNFHPIHLFLNTDSMSRYERSRRFFGSPKELEGMRNPGVGVATTFECILTSLIRPENRTYEG